MSGEVSVEGVTRLADNTSVECRICWYLYDPAAGDPDQQVPPGTPFLELPDYWRCPQCDSDPGSFLPVED
jgi:rubredoxin